MKVDVAEVLLVEDSQADVELTQYALKRGKVKVNLHVVRDGASALAFLRRKGQYTEAPQPDLILLDLLLPVLDGRQVLEDLKSDPDLKTIPVAIFTSSEQEEDILRSYALGANCYVNKPVDRKQFAKLVDCLADFWFTVVRLPKK